jgi:hypothetical protein
MCLWPLGCWDCGFESRQGVWMSVSCVCCVLIGRGPCVVPITRPEESYRMWCVWVWSWSLDNEETLAHWRLLRRWGRGWGNNRSSSFRCNILFFRYFVLEPLAVLWGMRRDNVVVWLHALSDVTENFSRNFSILQGYFSIVVVTRLEGFTPMANIRILH